MRLLVLGVTLTLTLQPRLVYAQLETFVQSVRELAAAAGREEPSRSAGIRAAASRMETALVEWDRNIGALEGRLNREIPGALDERAYQLHLELGVAYRVRGRTVDALREFEMAAALRPSSSDLQVLRALTFEFAGRSQEAGRAFLTAWKLDATNPVKAYYVAQRPDTGTTADRASARAFLAEAYQGMRFDAASSGAPFVTLDAIPDNLSLTPAIADEATSEGFALLAAGKYGSGVAVLRQTQTKGSKSGDSPQAHFASGQRDEAQNRVPEARRAYQAAIAGALVGRNVLLVAIARLAQVEGDLATAIDAFNRAVRLNPNDPNIHRELAGAYTADGRPDEAFCELLAALLINRRDAQVHADIGRLHLDAGRAAEALAAFNRALELTPDDYEIRYALAAAYARLGNSEEAARQLDMFDRLRREALERRRRDIADDVEREEALRRRLQDQGGGK